MVMWRLPQQADGSLQLRGTVVASVSGCFRPSQMELVVYSYHHKTTNVALLAVHAKEQNNENNARTILLLKSK